MTAEPERPDARRTFTDVASLFQSIVPPPGSEVRPQAEPPPLPPAVPLAAEQEEVSPAPAPVLETPSPTLRVAWEPQPNWQRPRPWTWVLLIPLALLGAGIVFFDNPRQLRDWFNEHVWAPPKMPEPPLAVEAESRANPPASAPAVPGSEPSAPPAPVASPPPIAPAPSVPEPPSPPPSGPAAPQAPASTVPAPPSGEAAPSQAAAPPEPASAPSEPAPVSAPAATAAQPAPAASAAPAPAQVSPIFGTVLIRYRRSQANSDPDAARLAAQVQQLASRVDLRAMSSGFRVPTILFFHPEDRDSATSLAQVITAENGPWNVRQGTGRQKPGTLEVWLP